MDAKPFRGVHLGTFYMGLQLRPPTLYLHIPFLTEQVPLSYTFDGTWYPLRKHTEGLRPLYS